MNYESRIYESAFSNYCKKNKLKKDLVCWDDHSAFIKYPKLNWVYDKFWMLKACGQEIYHLESGNPTLLDEQVELFIKPRYNLFGGSIGAYKFKGNFDNVPYKKGMVAQPLLKNNYHYSTDYLVVDGNVVDKNTFIGHKNTDGDFYLWETCISDKLHHSHKNQILLNLIVPKLKNGIINIENIGTEIIEAHLRGSNQFWDISGEFYSKFLKYLNRPYLLKRGYKPPKKVKGYSKVLRTDSDGIWTFHNLPDKFPKGITSIYGCWEPGHALSLVGKESNNYRLVIINGTNLSAIETFEKVLYNKHLRRISI